MDVQRYTMAATYGMHHKAPMVVWDWDVDGEWVRYDDHAAEVARLREALVPFARFGEGMTLDDGALDTIYLGGVNDDGTDFTVRKSNFIAAHAALTARKDGVS